MTDEAPREVTAEDLDKLIDATNRFASAADKLASVASAPVTNTNTTSFNLGGAGLLLGFTLGIGGLAFGYGMDQRAEAREIVMAAERRADMAELKAVRSEAEYARTQAGLSRTLAETIAQRVAILEGQK